MDKRQERVDVARIRAARDLVANHVESNWSLAPVFERLDAELRVAEAADAIEKARAIAALQRFLSTLRQAETSP
jgi:hypothetical protein